MSGKKEELEKQLKELGIKGCIVEKYVKCGKPNCNKCPHGPYYYLVWRENGKTRWKYLGKNPDLKTEKCKKEDLSDYLFF